MKSELELFKERLEIQINKLRRYFAQMGISYDFYGEIEKPNPEEPLAELFEHLEIVQDNLRGLHEENKSYLDTLDRRVAERTAELEAQLKIISAQRQTILELSTPVIEIWEGIVILPLIGVVDTFRARQILENMLGAITETQAEVAIIDITGVPVVDTEVAHHFLKTIDAAKMLGTQIILTGVSPYNAQTLVQLGVDLAKIPTKGALLSGLKMAFEMTGKEVKDKE